MRDFHSKNQAKNISWRVGGHRKLPRIRKAWCENSHRALDLKENATVPCAKFSIVAFHCAKSNSHGYTHPFLVIFGTLAPIFLALSCKNISSIFGMLEVIQNLIKSSKLAKKWLILKAKVLNELIGFNGYDYYSKVLKSNIFELIK